MKFTEKITRFVAATAMMVLLLTCGPSTPQGALQGSTPATAQGAGSSAPANNATPVTKPAPDTTAAQPAKFDGYVLYKAVFETLRDRHITLVDPAARAKWVAEWENKHAKDGKLDTEKGADEACLEMMRSLNQRFDYYFVPEQTKAEETSQAPSYQGTGLVVTIFGAKPSNDVRKVDKDHPFMVAHVIDGSPASRTDVRKFDRITAIDGKPVDGKTLEEAVAMLHGANGVPVVISIERGMPKATEKLTVTIVRADYVRKVVHFRDLGEGVSYVKLDNFMSQFSVKEMVDALQKASKGTALILDLRGNPGGSLLYVEMMSQFFLEEGTVLEQHERQGDELFNNRLVLQPGFALRTERSSSNPTAISAKPEERLPTLLPKNMPVVVLVDDDSYSASEILAGALQQNHRAVVVGLPTGGKGVGQVVRKLPFGRSAHVTSFEFLPGGAAMDWVGVIPDIEVKQSDSFDGDDPTTDAQLKAALTQVKSMLEAQKRLNQEQIDLRKKNEESFNNSRKGGN